MSVIFAEAAAQWREMKAEYDRFLESSYWAAEEATNGFMVNRAGKAAGIDSLSLFTGPAGRAYRFASEELLAYWAEHPRPSLALFEAQWASSRLGGDY